MPLILALNPKRGGQSKPPSKTPTGYYVMGQHTSLAWYKTKAQAQAEVDRLKMIGAWSGTPPRVEPSYNPRRRNPHLVIDSGLDRISKIFRGDPARTFQSAYAAAKRLARATSRPQHVVAHPYVPKGWKTGTQVSKLFYHMGPYQTVRPNPARRNPLSTAAEKAYRAWRRAADKGYGSSPIDTPFHMERVDARIRRLKAKYEALVKAKNPARRAARSYRLMSSRHVDRRSIRTIRLGRTEKRMRVGCPKNYWSARKRRCSLGMRGISVLLPKRNPYEVRRVGGPKGTIARRFQTVPRLAQAKALLRKKKKQYGRFGKRWFIRHRARSRNPELLTVLANPKRRGPKMRWFKSWTSPSSAYRKRVRRLSSAGRSTHMGGLAYAKFVGWAGKKRIGKGLRKSVKLGKRGRSYIYEWLENRKRRRTPKHTGKGSYRLYGPERSARLALATSKGLGPGATMSSKEYKHLKIKALLDELRQRGMTYAEIAKQMRRLGPAHWRTPNPRRRSRRKSSWAKLVKRFGVMGAVKHRRKARRGR